MVDDPNTGGSEGFSIKDYIDPDAVDPRNVFQFYKLFGDFITAIVVAIFTMMAAGVLAWQQAIATIGMSVEFLIERPVFVLRVTLSELPRTAATLASEEAIDFGIFALTIGTASALAALLVLVIGINVFITRTED